MFKDEKEKGSVLVICALMIPVLLGFIGIAIDAGYILYQRNCLYEATEVAGHSGLLMSYDLDIWENENRVVLQEESLMINVSLMFEKNFPNGEIIEVKKISDNAFEVSSQVQVPYFFMGILGFENKIIEFKQKFVGG